MRQLFPVLEVFKCMVVSVNWESCFEKMKIYFEKLEGYQPDFSLRFSDTQDYPSFC